MRHEIGFNERKQIQLDMLKEVDLFCKENNIRYSLAFGTLLGAVRHKGFIPWDDDVDIMMPLPDLLRFKEIFYSKKLKYCDIDTEKHFEYHFSRIAHKDTYNQRGFFFRSYGICIDVYIIISIPDTPRERELFFAEACKLQEKRLLYMKARSFLTRFTHLSAIPGFDEAVRNYHDYLLKYKDYNSTKTWYALAGALPLRNKMIYDYDIFENMTELQFEDKSYPVISSYDKYLTLRYGDYMQLPPEKDRHPYHGGHYYWK